MIKAKLRFYIDSLGNFINKWVKILLLKYKLLILEKFEKLSCKHFRLYLCIASNFIFQLK